MINSNKERIVTYEYDSWGKVLSIYCVADSEWASGNESLVPCR